MSSSWAFIKKIFNIYSRFFLKLITLIGCFFIYFLGISIGHLFYKFSRQENFQRWQKVNSDSLLEEMY